MYASVHSLVNMNWRIQICITLVLSIHIVCGNFSPTEFDGFRSEFHVTGDGFHREMRLSSISLPSSIQDCRILIKWTIPVGVYVDPYQLQSSVKNGTVHFSNQVNVEQMAHHTKPLVLHTLPNLDCTSSSCSFSQSIPLHSRYHLPSTDDYATVFLPSPTSYLSCECNSQPAASWNKCVWQELGKPDVLGHEILVAIGDLSHSLLVTVVTIGVSFLGTCYIGWIALIR